MSGELRQATKLTEGPGCHAQPSKQNAGRQPRAAPGSWYGRCLSSERAQKHIKKIRRSG